MVLADRGTAVLVTDRQTDSTGLVQQEPSSQLFLAHSVRQPYLSACLSVQLNFLSVALLAQAVLPHMLARRTGHIVVTTSFSGRVGKGREEEEDVDDFRFYT